MLIRELGWKTEGVLRPEDDLILAWQRMQSLMVGGLPVVDKEGRPVGVLSWRGWHKLCSCCREQCRNYKVADVMAPVPVLLNGDALFSSCWQIKEIILPIINDEGKLVGYLDKTWHGPLIFDRAVNMLKQVELILDSAHNGIIAINKEGIVTIFNHAAEVITRRPKSQAIGRHLSQVIIPQGLLDILKSGQSQICHKFAVDYSAGRRVYITNRNPIIENGEIVGAIGVFQDISEMEFISEELNTVKQLNKELQGIIESSYDGILVTDAAGKVIKVNRAFQRLTGIEAEQIQGHNAGELPGNEQVAAVVAEVARHKVARTSAARTPGGRDLLITGNPVFDERGELIRVVVNIRDLTELNELRRELDASKELTARYHTELAQLRARVQVEEGIICSSTRMQELVKIALRVAQVDSTVLILGESGTGKEVLARFIHRHSTRSEGPFITVNCGAIPESLLESELFGYEKGAFTGANREGKPGLFELAHNGTIFLDEIGEVPPTFQVKLLRVLQEKEVLRVGGNKPRPINVRIIAATNRDLAQLVKEGLFREDLFFRLNVVPLTVPPLRERREDIVALALLFNKKFNARYGLNRRLSPEVVDVFQRYHWPGNVRELENLIERLMVTVESDLITVRDLPSHVLQPALNKEPVVVVRGLMTLKEAVQEVERQLLTNALREYGSTYRAAKALGVDQSTVVRKLQRLRIKLNDRTG